MSYYESLTDLMKALNEVNKENYADFFAVCEVPPFKSLLIQRLTRNIDGEEQDFLSIRDIDILPSHRGKGHFKKIFNLIESKKVPFYFDDVVNPKLDSYLNKKGYKINRTEKNGHSIYSRYKGHMELLAEDNKTKHTTVLKP